MWALARERPPSPQGVARWITTAPPRRGLCAAEGLRLLEQCRELDRTHNLVRQFGAMLDARDAAALPDGLKELTTAGFPALAGFEDYCPRPEHRPRCLWGSCRAPSAWRCRAAVHRTTARGPRIGVARRMVRVTKLVWFIGTAG